MPKFYEYRHVVGFEETNVAGNVYYANYVRWQGRCREMFLKEYAPDVLDLLNDDLALVTLHVSCDYLAELYAFDEVTLRMSLAEMVQNRVTMQFDYHKADGILCARGRQQIACMRRSGTELLPTDIPRSMQKALEAYR